MIQYLRLLTLLLLLCPHQVIAHPSSDMNGQLALGRAVRGVALAPDGHTIVAVVTDTTAAGGHAHLWILSKGTAPRQITGTGADGSADDSNPAWESDGRAIVYLEKAGGGAAIKRIDVGSARTDTLVLSRRDKALSADWGTSSASSPFVAKGFALATSGAIAVWATDTPDKSDMLARKEDQHVFGRAEQARLYLIDDPGPRVLTLPDDVRSVTWRKDGHALLVVTEPASDDLGALNRLWLIEQYKEAREIRATA